MSVALAAVLETLAMAMNPPVDSTMNSEMPIDTRLYDFLRELRSRRVTKSKLSHTKRLVRQGSLINFRGVGFRSVRADMRVPTIV